MRVHYENRIVAYFDILGWKSASQDPNQAKRIRKVASELQAAAYMHSKLALRGIRAIAAPGNSIEEYAKRQQKIQMAAFSDNVALSALTSDVGEFVEKTSGLCRSILEAGFLVRGGISIGALYHREGVVFGPALIEAVAFEQTASLPRLLCSNEARKLLEANVGEDRCPVFIDVLGRSTLNLFPSNVFVVRPHTPQLNRIRNSIARGLDGVISDSHRAEKWNYMKGAVDGMLSDDH